ncbi:MAG: leucyl aminopeptidase [Gammaproteobacteria bacterium]|nr:leucyl aminopeptidase [Gammaproteobacteria bacterium]
MKFTIKSEKPAEARTGCVILGVFEKHKLSPAAARFDKAAGGLLTRLVKDGEIDGTCGKTLIIHYPEGALCDRVMLVGCGKEGEFNEECFCKAVSSTAKAANACGATDAVSYLAELKVNKRDGYWKIRTLVEKTESTLFKPNGLKSSKNKNRKPLRSLGIHPGRTDGKQAARALKDGKALAGGVELARTLGNLPGNICTPSYLAAQARKLGRAWKTIKTSVLEEAAMKKLGMGSLLSVSRGSVEPAKLITLEYSGGKKGSKPVVLVGKGVTFDSGGISLKPGAAMDEMKFDMCGAASVLGTLQACAEMKIKLNVVGVIPTTENLPSDKATKPGDVVTSMSGKTIEILNTDAEGRLILCDALTYCRKFKPEVVVDIATLTGACVVALGHHTAAVLSNDDELAEELMTAGKTATDRAWQMPLWDVYQSALDSNFADIANIGGRAGTITAACFLSRFTKDYRWAHLDIAGVAWKSGKAKGATGRPVPLLTQFLLDRCAAR